MCHAYDAAGSVDRMLSNVRAEFGDRDSDDIIHVEVGDVDTDRKSKSFIPLDGIGATAVW